MTSPCHLSLFDKVCGVLAFALGVVFLLVGAIGLFTGSSAHFTLPPVLGVIPAFVGWGMVRCIVVAFRASRVAPALDGRRGSPLDDPPARG